MTFKKLSDAIEENQVVIIITAFVIVMASITVWMIKLHKD